MTYQHCLSILGFIWATNAFAYEPKIEIIEQFDNLKMIAFIDKKVINNNPEWNPNISSPPLSVSEAISAVKHFLKPAKGLIDIKEIEIREVPRHEKHWHYLIKVANNKMKSKYNIYVVLMTGVVIPAIIQPQSFK